MLPLTHVMAKKFKNIKCVYCLEDFEQLTSDHVFPKSWYPETTPLNMKKAQVPCCFKCNQKYSAIEQRILELMGVCLEPGDAMSLGIPEKAIQSIKPEFAKTRKEREIRKRKKKKLLTSMKSASHGILQHCVPGFGNQWGYPIEALSYIPVPSYDLILFGEGSVDSYSGILGPRVAERLNIPEICYVRKIDIEGERVIAEHALEDRIEVIEGGFPLLITVTNEINEPRIPSYMLIIKAKKKPMTTWTAGDLDIEKAVVGPDGSGIEVIDVIAPKVERKRIKISGETTQEITDELANSIIKEGVLGG